MKRIILWLIFLLSISSLTLAQTKKIKANNLPDNTFGNKGNNNWLSFSIGNGVSNGKAIGLSFMGRHGKLVGIGYAVGFGMGPILEESAQESVYLHYNAGIKFYPWQNLYLGGYYGTVSFQKESGFNENNHWSTGGGEYSANGLSFLLGYDFCFGDRNKADVGGVIGTGIGVSFVGPNKWMPDFKTMLPAWNVSIGLIF